jgi:hypothetical protein
MLPEGFLHGRIIRQERCVDLSLLVQSRQELKFLRFEWEECAQVATGASLCTCSQESLILWPPSSGSERAQERPGSRSR